MLPQILVAENESHALQTTSKHLNNHGFSTIPVSSKEGAYLVIKYCPALAAIVLDERLSDDDDQHDHTGLDLAQETLREARTSAPIILYSQFDPPPQISDHPGTRGISFVSKLAGPMALVDKVRELVNLNLRTGASLGNVSRYDEPPIIIFGKESAEIDELQGALRNANTSGELCRDLSELKVLAANLPSAMFIVEVSDDNGLEAINALNDISVGFERRFCVIALASGKEFKERVSQANVDGFVVRHSPQTDALEIMTRMPYYKIEMEKIAAKRRESELALGQYQELKAELGNLKNSDGHNVGRAVDSIQRALNWQFLTADETLILTSLYLKMRSLKGQVADPEALDICIAGASMLAADRAASGNVQEWMGLARRHSADFTMAWIGDDLLLDEDEYDEGEEDYDDS